MVQEPCKLDTWSNKHTIRICNTLCFSTATMVARTPQCYIIRKLPVLFWFKPKFKCLVVLKKAPNINTSWESVTVLDLSHATRWGEARMRSFNYSVQNCRSCWNIRSLGRDSNPGATGCLYRSTNNPTTTFASVKLQDSERTRYKDTQQLNKNRKYSWLTVNCPAKHLDL